nr:MAG TPA: Helix-turn-helix XRE-family like protein [Caudoviricetes sp.]
MKPYENVKKIRNQLGLSQRKVAEQLGITQQGYNLIENGKRKLDVDTIIKLSNIFNINPISIINGEEYDENNIFAAADELTNKLKRISHPLIIKEDSNYIEHYYIGFKDGYLEIDEKQVVELNKRTDDFLRFQLEQLKAENKDNFTGK